jgi:predicted DNA-binding helix-hairpin-helix protein
MMDLEQRLNLLTQDAGYEGDQLPNVSTIPNLESSDIKPPVCFKKDSKTVPEITYAKKSNGGQISLLKTVLTSACEKDCNYCVFRAGRDFRRATMKPDELASIFHNMTVAGISEGLFLSSGIAGGGIRTQDKLIDTAEILRLKYQYRGYLHLKIMPGAEFDQIERAMQISSRVSINLEAPNQLRLSALAPHKDFSEELLKPLQWAAEIRNKKSPTRTFDHRWPSLATQLVVGASHENDHEILQTSQYLFSTLGLSRIYYSAFTPVIDTPFENLPPENPIREFRLYQASFLLRNYGYTYKDLIYESNGHLPLDIDPKQAWAKQNLFNAPIEINSADQSSLLHIPGIGVKGAQAILRVRRQNPIKNLGDLHRLGINPERVSPYILLNGRRPLQQLSLW